MIETTTTYRSEWLMRCVLCAAPTNNHLFNARFCNFVISKSFIITSCLEVTLKDLCSAVIECLFCGITHSSINIMYGIWNVTSSTTKIMMRNRRACCFSNNFVISCEHEQLLLRNHIIVWNLGPLAKYINEAWDSTNALLLIETTMFVVIKSEWLFCRFYRCCFLNVFWNHFTVLISISI